MVGMSTAQTPTAVSHLELVVSLTAVEMYSARTLRDVAQLVLLLSVVHCSQLTRKSKLSQGSHRLDSTTAGDWDCVAVVELLPALHYSVDFIFLSFGIIGFIVEL